MPREFRSFRVDAIVLKHYDYGEADRMLTIYTRERGKLKVIAKGVRKVRSRKAGHLEPFMHASLLLATGRNLFLVSQAEAQNSFPKLRENLEMIGYASYTVELVDKFTFEEEENAPVFTLLKQTLMRLERGDEPMLAIRYFEIRMLDVLGFRPELQQCVVTGAAIQPEDQYFSASQGGAISPLAGKGQVGAVPISMYALKYLRHLQRSSYREAVRAKIPPAIQQEMETIMQYYITYLLERGLNSPSFLRRVRREGEGNRPEPD